MKKTVYVGIDISKDTLDVAICSNLEQKLYNSFKVDNNINGINKLITKCLKQSNDLWFCFEHTGNYGLLLSIQLQATEFKYSAVPALEIQKSLGIIRGKTDPIDAKRIAEYAATQKHKLKPTNIAGETLLKIKSLLTFRSQLTKTRISFKNSLKSHKITAQSIDIKNIIKRVEENIIDLDTQIKQLEKEILDLINSDEDLKSNYLKATSVIGVGPIITFYMLVYTNNFTSFNNARKFNCYCGLAPFEYSSGSSIKKRTKTSNLRNKKMKALLFNGANTAIRSDMELAKYYKRKIKEGKHHQVVTNNIACKLISRVFAVINREQLYLNLQK